MSDGETTQKKARQPKRQRRPRGQLYIEADPRSGIYQIRGKVRGITVRESTGTRDAEAADALRIKREREILDESVYGTKAVATFADAVNLYLSARDGGGYRRYLPALVEEFGDVKLKDITAPRVSAYVERMHGGCSGATKNIYVVNPMTTVLRFASMSGLCDAPVLIRYKKADSKIVAAPPEWIEEFLARAQHPRRKALVALLTTTGCRCIDALRLRSEHVDYEAGTAFLPKTKNGDSRTLQLIAPVLDMLRAFDHSPDGRVFGYSNTTSANNAIAKECRRLGLMVYSSHKIGRHAFAERLLNAGHTLKEVQEAGGWRDVSTLSNKYGHLEKSRVSGIVRDQATSVFRKTLRSVG